MTIPFVLARNLDVALHQFRVYESNDGNDPEWLKSLAKEYVKILTHRETRLKNISLGDHDLSMDVQQIQKYLHKASIPTYKPGNFNVVRSDFGELLCYLLLERDYHTLFGAKSIMYRELRDLPGRGIDAIGVEKQDRLTLVLCEVKVSDEQLSPPRIVDYTDDSLSKQQRYHLTHLLEATKDKIWRVANRTRDEECAELLTAAAMYLEEGRLDKLHIVACNVLIRPKTKHKQNDFGSFRKNPVQYDPAKIRFLIACVPDNIDDMIMHWYNIVQNMEVSV